MTAPGERDEDQSLLATRRFAPFFIVQFLGAFNDNLFKNALVVLLTFQAAGWTTLSPGVLANVAAGLFMLPFFLFSASAGQLADKFDKTHIARGVKLLEMAVMAIAGAGFALKNLQVLFIALFLLGVHSALFGPVKYAILPQLLRREELVAGNAWVEAGTFVAILLGTLAGALLAAVDAAATWITVGGLSVAVLGYAASRAMPPAPPPAPGLRLHRNPLAETAANLRRVREQPQVFAALLAISWFWLYGALYLAQFPALARLLGGGEVAVTLLLLAFTAGIGGGSLLCRKLSRSGLTLAPVAWGAAGLSLAGLDAAWAIHGFEQNLPSTAALRPLAALLADSAAWRLLTDLVLLGVAGGLFGVPLYTLMQVASPAEQRARTVAANNILNAAFMLAGALGAAVLLGAGVSLAMLFTVAAIANGVFLAALHRRLGRPPATVG